MKKRYSVTLTEPYLTALDALVERGLYPSGQSVVRAALRELFERHGIEPFRAQSLAEPRK